MRGHVHKRGSTWGYVVDVGRDPATGKRKQRTKGGFRTRAAAEDALTEVLNEIRSGTVVAPSSVTLEEYLTEWLTTVRPQLRETTWASYGVAVQRICWGLGAGKLQALTAVEVERFYARLVNEGGPAGRPLAAKTVRNTHIVLHRALADAERLRLVMRNVAHLARPPAVPHVERATWTADELAAFLEHVSGDRLFAAYVLLATTGMRRGEVFGLRWRDVDLSARRASVTQTVTTVNDKLVLGPTKTNRSRRTISLDPTTVDVLHAHRVVQDQERATAGQAWDPSYDLVLCDGTGRPEHPDRFSRQFQRYVKATDLPPLRGPHNLRHTWATLALRAGVHPKVVSDRLGHATIAVTIDTYSHVAPSLDAEAADTVAADIFGSSA
ncbi:MAG TPA: tyrosine-type recombinase/integrase [Microthrixaceae bacterium]|nr:tyrosine-type recombinase/integrase [Microthrixaceae bacterium]HMV74767.1 tyrosine-type recombinase/integrase [Microthrixaceae bacterium]HMX64261.1 tyrosine-type recombinase/integrase [Microthrixaceae bacterium]HMY85908.1 tyrosine-type recombinase/integrase [Microthrixaceae bacterium]HNA35774.1 tyrosine-type recombinase/integrase [Microthrixaceae bacterium]